jgi:hypothetical protein
VQTDERLVYAGKRFCLHADQLDREVFPAVELGGIAHVASFSGLRPFVPRIAETLVQVPHRFLPCFEQLFVLVIP